MSLNLKIFGILKNIFYSRRLSRHIMTACLFAHWKCWTLN